MATKPTKRILDWASGGTATDPGAGKEAAGWLTAERPPAQWWNWILQSFGDWLAYFEDKTDESSATAYAYVVTDGAGGATVTGNGFSTSATVTSTQVGLDFSTTQAGTNYAVVASSFDASSDDFCVVDSRTTATTTCRFYTSSSHTVVNPSTTVVRFSIVVFGDGT